MKEIIVVEDSTLIRTNIINTLKSHGYNNVVGFSEAEQISNRTQEFFDKVSLILLDIRLPGMSGIELAEKIKHKNIPIIFLTSNSDVKTVKKAIDAGALDYIVKPFKEEILLKRINKVLGESIVIDNAKKTIRIEYKRAQRANQSCSFININNLNFQDDSVSKAEHIIESIVREIDIVLTFNNFILIILPLTNKNGVEIVKEKLLKNLNENNIKEPKFKVVSLEPNTKTSKEKLIKELLGDL